MARIDDLVESLLTENAKLDAIVKFAKEKGLNVAHQHDVRGQQFYVFFDKFDDARTFAQLLKGRKDLVPRYGTVGANRPFHPPTGDPQIDGRSFVTGLYGAAH